MSLGFSAVGQAPLAATTPFSAPRILLLDDTTRADSATVVGTPAIGGAYTTWNSTVWGISSNRIYNPGADSRAALVVDFGTESQDVTVTEKGTSFAHSNGVVLRGTSATNMIAASHDDSAVYVLLVTGTSYSVKSGSSHTFVAGTDYRFRATAIGNVISIYVDGAFIWSYTLTGGDITTYVGTYAGLWDNNDSTERFGSVIGLDAGPPATSYTQGVGGALASAATLARKAAKHPVASLTPAGALARLTGKKLIGALTDGGVVTPVWIAGTMAYAQSVAGGMTPTGTLARRTGKALTGVLTDAGALVRKATKVLAGALTPSGTLAKAATKAFAGTLTDSGALTRSGAKSLNGALTSSGALARLAGKALAGALTDSGALVRRGVKLLAGVLTPSGMLARKLARSLAGAITPSATLAAGALRRQSISGAMTPSGTLTRKAAKVLAGTLTTAGALVRRIGKVLAGSLTPSAGRVVISYDYYVDSIAGSDSNSGTDTAHPWATVAKVNGLSSGTINNKAVAFKCGSTWREQILMASGVSGVLLGSYDTGALPIITGADPVTGWTLTSGIIYHATVTTQPNIVFSGTARLTHGASAGTLTDGQWYWVSNVLSIGSAAGSPTGIEAGARNAALDTNAAANLTVDSLTLTRSNADESGVYGHFQPQGLTVVRCNITDHYGAGVHINGTSDTVTLDDNYIAGCGTLAIYQSHDANTNQLIDTNLCEDCGWRTDQSTGQVSAMVLRLSGFGVVAYNTIRRCGAGSPTGLYEHGIYVGGALDDAALVHDNLIEDMSKGYGMKTRSGGTWYRNTIRNCVGGGFDVAGNGTTNINVLFHHNDIAHCGTGSLAGGGVAIDRDTGTIGFKGYNNTLNDNSSGVGSVRAELAVFADIGGLLDWRNNVVVASSGGKYIQSPTQTTTPLIDYNDYYGTTDAGNPFYYAGYYNFAGWKALGITPDAHGLNVDPLFTDSGSDDFTLQSGSPAIDVGVVISGITDGYAGTAPDMGAFEKTSSLFTQTLAGVLTFAGVLTKRAIYLIAGGLTPSGSLSRRAAKPLSGSLTPSGALARRIAKTFAGVLTPSGTLARKALKTLAGAITSSGALSRKAGKALAGALTPSGALARKTVKLLSGALMPSGIVSTLQGLARSLAGSLTSSGALSRKAGKIVGGTLMPAGALVKKTAKMLAGVITSAGALGTVRGFLVGLSGALTSSGALARKANKMLAGSLSSAGALLRRTAKAFSGALTPTGSLAKQAGKPIAGSLTPTGALGRLAVLARLLTGSIAPSGFMRTMPEKVLTGTLAATGALTQAFFSGARKLLVLFRAIR